jgi:hypothetical protein
MTDHSLLHHQPLSIWPLVTSLRTRLQERAETRRIRRLNLLTRREIMHLPDHMLKDIGYFDR